ncbi:hypothetical protein GCM10007423_63540 [Dyadobacter endophyticus]|uniref:DUF6705 domain-containing protein n=1 Tax=Dyadobacter endophyticus TaxID=1749036 RepID=A0ABQ1ZCX9_9BACT|nr:DUF6705 family protein [Dyadobacter endophyticus]GGH55711.1 hypothetical protein GCM10007423_63540 [Dyadobacter endophyticus]
MKPLFVFFALLFVSCSKDTPEPDNISADAKAERAASSLDSFVGEWIYTVDNQPYKKIIVTKQSGAYTFKHYVMLAGAYELDKDVYEAQDLLPINFVPWDKSPTFQPLVSIKSSFTSGSAAITYRVISGKIYLELGISKYLKEGI